MMVISIKALEGNLQRTRKKGFRLSRNENVSFVTASAEGTKTFRFKI